MTHTPGPWKWRPQSESRIGAVSADMRMGIQRAIAIRPQYDTDEAWKANAALIAAAPDLLEACKTAQSYISVRNPDATEKDIRTLRAAIEKATSHE